jgi:hypothetical protein
MDAWGAAGQASLSAALHILRLFACMRTMTFGQGTASAATQDRSAARILHDCMMGERIDGWMDGWMLARPSGLFP